MAPSRLAPLVLCLAVLGIAVSGPLVRYTDAPAVAVAVGRLTFTMPIVLAGLWLSGQWRELRTLAAADVQVAAGAGALLAVHFWSWIASLSHVSVASSVLLVNLHPVLVVLGALLWLGERPRPAQLGAIALTMLGAGLVAWGDAGGAAPRPAPLRGALLALTGAATVAGYLLAGRRLRQRLGLWGYVTLVYGACLVVLLVIAAATRTPVFAGPPRDLWVFAAMAAGPMLLGHTGVNWALAHLPVWAVSITVLGEPVGATLIAWVALHERPAPLALLGGALVLLGLGWAALRPRAPRD